MITIYNKKFDTNLRNYKNYIFLGKITCTMYINVFLLKTHNHDPVEIMLQKHEVQQSQLKHFGTLQ